MTVNCLLMTGCGFAPMYAQKNTAAAQLAFSDIEISSIPDREGQALRNILIDRIYAQGRPRQARYLLKLSPLREDVTRLGIRKDASATRAQMEIETRLTLLDRQAGRIVLERRLRSINSFNILRSQYTIEVSEADARERALRDLGEQVVAQLGLYFNRAPQP